MFQNNSNRPNGSKMDWNGHPFWKFLVFLSIKRIYDNFNFLFSFSSLMWFIFILFKSDLRSQLIKSKLIIKFQVNLFYFSIHIFWWRKINKQTKGALRNWIETLLEKTNYLNHLLLNINEFAGRRMLMIAFKTSITVSLWSIIFV